MKEIDVFALRKLSTHSKTSKIGKIRAVFDDIEKLVNAGVALQAIVDELNKQGIETNLPNFKTMLFRIRKSREKCCDNGLFSSKEKILK